MSDGYVVQVGNVTKDPEIRVTNSGKSVAKFSIAKNTRRQVDGEWVDGKPEFFDVTVWDKLAENLVASEIKGKRVIVMGHLKQETWGEGEDKRSKVVIVAEDVAVSARWGTVSFTKAEGGSSKPKTKKSEPDWDADDEPPF